MRRFLPLLIIFICTPLMGRIDSAAAPMGSIRAGALLIKVRAPSSYAHVQALLPAGATVEAPIGPSTFALRVPSGAEYQYAAYLATSPDVVYVQPDHRVAAQIQPDDPRYGDQWNMAALGMPQAWQVITDSSSLTIALLDTGALLDHPDLQGQWWLNRGEVAGNDIDDDGNGYVDDLHGWHFYQTYRGGEASPHDDAVLNDPNGHGTHVAGIVAARGNNGMGVSGVNWRAQIMVVRVLDDDAIGWESDVVRGMNYAIANGAQIINLSLGLSEQTPALADTVAQAEAHGVLVVAAAGNSGAVLYPAAYPTVLSVGASGRDGTRASFSAQGPRLDLLAPGVDILSTWNGVPYFARSGTSMAAPHAAGVAALLWADKPDLTPEEIRTCLKLTATDIGPPGRDNGSGAGLLNAAQVMHGCQRATYLPLLPTH